MSSNRTVLITGVSSGIGNGLARHYLDRGDTVLGISRRAPADLSGENFHFISLDLCDESGVQTRLPEFVAEHGDLSTGVLNAGVLGEIGDLKDASLAELRSVMDANVWSYKTVIDVLLSGCRSVERIITMSSGAAVNGNRGWSGYSISKAALNMLTMLYSRENPSVHFAAVAPGLVDTAMQDYLCGQASDPRFPSLDTLKSKRRTAEMPKPDEVAKKLVSLFDSVEKHVESGGFVDIRHLPEINES